ncbi:MAG: hypothetical protein U0401_11885 [Anaerolineae bacterium]
MGLKAVYAPDERDDDFLEAVAPVGDEIIINKTSAGARLTQRQLTSFSAT